MRPAFELVAAESRPLRAVLVFDTSSSVVGGRLSALKAAGEAFLNGLRPADQVALVGFSEGVPREGWHRIEVKLRGHKGDVQARHGYWAAPGVR